MQGEYLSNIINLNDFKKNCLNLIEAPCGSGKTTFAIEKLTKINPSGWGTDMLYLIDSKIGKEQLLRTKGIEYGINPWTDQEEWWVRGVRIMTYAGYAMLCEMVPKKDLWCEETLILCDELQNAIGWCYYGEDNLHRKAISLIKHKICHGNNIVVAISATPQKIKEAFSEHINTIPLKGNPRHYENKNVIHYRNLSLLLNKIDHTQKGIIYLTRIEEILKYKDIIDEKGIKSIALWSPNNTDYKLSETQKEVRSYIIENSTIPDDIQVLFINKSAETSISLGKESDSTNKIDYIIVHSTNLDAQIQVRGRYRNDLNTLYLYDKSKTHIVELDNKWLNKELSKTDKTQLCNELNLKNNGRLLKWPSLKEILINSGYIVEDKHKNKSRFSIITM